MFWTLVGWKFAFAELFGGAIIIAVVAAGLTVLFPRGALDRLREQAGNGGEGAAAAGDTVPVTIAAGAASAGSGPGPVPACGAGRPGLPVEEQDVVCGMTGSPEHAVAWRGREYRFCSAGCARGFAVSPARYAPPGEGEAGPPQPPLASLQTWYAIAARAWGDVKMLRTELIAGYLLARFAEALIPEHALSQLLHAVGSVPVIGYVLLLLLGLAIAVATFVCSMGNVPVARFLKAAGVPLGANTAYIYGDLLILPLVQIYRRSFPSRLAAAFLGLFTAGACLAGAAMETVMHLLP